MADEDKKKTKNIHTSYVGTFKADSLKTEDGVVSAILVVAGKDGATVEKAIKGYNAHAQTLTDAVAAGGEMIVRGTLLASGKHLAIYGTGAEQIAGVVSNVRSNLDTYEAAGKVPYVNAFVLVERGEHKIGAPITAYGDDALALKGMEKGDRIDMPARQTQEQQGDKWVAVYRCEGAATFEKAPVKEADETPAP